MDVIADLLTRIRNGLMARKRYVDIPTSKMKSRIVEIFKEHGFVENFLISEQKKLIRVYLKYNKSRRPVIHEIKRISKPGLRKYVKHQEIPNIKNGLGLTVLSTTDGIVDGLTAKENKLGGELICSVW